MTSSLRSQHIELPPDFRGQFRTDELARALYSEGAGIARSIPAAVAVPVDREDAGTLVRWARGEGHGLIPRGSGSGMAAGAVGSAIVVDLSRFKAIGQVETVDRRMRAGCGALRGDIDAAAREAGLRFPVDPSSGAFCTIGGMAGTNAAGARSLRFGATRVWTTGLHCVFDDGSSAWIRRNEVPPANIPAVQRLRSVLEAIDRHANFDGLAHVGVRKESSGYALGVAAHRIDSAAVDTSSARAPAPSNSGDGNRLVDLLVGSEGTLALFTEVELALTPVAAATATVLAVFGSLEAAAACAAQARDAGASACELLDRTFLDVAARDSATGVAVGAAASIPAGAEAVLLCEVEATDRGEAALLAHAFAQSCRRHGATEVLSAVDKSAEHKLWALRHAASPILARLAPRLRSMQFIEDGCVPPDRFPEYVRGVRDALARFDTLGVIFGHAGDSHAHVNPLIDVTKAAWRDRMRGLLQETCELTARCGGTLAGEHGDGRLRAPLLPYVWSDEARAAFANVKAAGDPAGVFNPGCKIARPGDDGLASIRYDPEAAALPPAARAALDSVERDRAWHRFRLGLTGEILGDAETRTVPPA